MQAITLNGTSLYQLTKIELPDPAPPGHGQVLVRMRAGSLNFLDLAVAHGQYPGLNYPLVPVADGAGEVIATGDGVADVAIGDRIALHPKTTWFAGRGSTERAGVTRAVAPPGPRTEIA